MKRIEMKPLLATQGSVKLILPGEWEAFVPEMVPRGEDDIVPYMRALMQEGRPPGLARDEVVSLMQEKWESKWLTDLRQSLRYYALMYAERWPHLVDKDGSLRGFDAEKMQTIYFPGDNTGRRGKVFAKTMMGEMARGADNGR